MSTTRDGKGYQVPTPIDPGELQCFRVYVPKHSWYIGAFWQAYEFFTNWLAWARDPLKKGKQAAQVWRVAYDKARSEYLKYGGCIMAITDIRVDPLNPCRIQVQIDGGATWVNKADLSRCGGGNCGGSGVYQFDGETVNQWDDCLQQWTPVAPPVVSGESGTYVSTYPSDGECDGAANITAWLADMAHSQLSAMATGANIGQIATLVVQAMLISVGINTFISAVFELLLAEFSEDSAVLADAADLDISEAFKNILVTYVDGDGTLREPRFTAAINALYARRNQEAINTAERVKWGHMANLLSLAGPFVASRNNKWAGLTGQTCDSAQWSQTFDFPVARNGYYAVIFEGTYWATWYETEGWRSRWDGGINGDAGNRRNWIARDFALAALTSAYIEYDATITPNNVHHSAAMTTAPANNTLTWDVVTGVGQSKFWDLTGTNATAFAVSFDLRGQDGLGDPNGDVLIKRIIITGTGINPFL